MLGSLLASVGWILDLAFFLALVLGVALGAYKGFVAGVCRLAGVVASFIFACVFCISFAAFLETCFHMTSAIARGISDSIARNPLYNELLPSEITGAELGSFFDGKGLNGLATWLIERSFAGIESFPAGTTPAMMLGSVLAKWISVAIAFVLLFVLIRAAVWLLEKFFGRIKDAIAPIRIADQLLGALLGLAKAAFVIFVVMLILNWIPIAALHDFIASSTVVGKIFTSEWFQAATSYAISGKWFNDFLQKLLPN